MSELKAFTFILGRYTEDGYPCVVAVDDEDNLRLASDEEFYLKSEADKVIAKLKDKALQYKVLDKEHCRDLNTQERFFAKQIAYNKYKRCLAIARWCASRSVSWCLDPADEQLHKSEFYDKWKHRWLVLAEKFKEAK